MSCSVSLNRLAHCRPKFCLDRSQALPSPPASAVTLRVAICDSCGVIHGCSRPNPQLRAMDSAILSCKDDEVALTATKPAPPNRQGRKDSKPLGPRAAAIPPITRAIRAPHGRPGSGQTLGPFAVVSPGGRDQRRSVKEDQSHRSLQAPSAILSAVPWAPTWPSTTAKPAHSFSSHADTVTAALRPEAPHERTSRGPNLLRREGRKAATSRRNDRVPRPWPLFGRPPRPPWPDADPESPMQLLRPPSPSLAGHHGKPGAAPVRSSNRMIYQ
jgi:hypothetical protein